MNNRGSVAIFGLMLAITIIVLALALAPVGRDFVSSAMNESTSDLIGLNCNNETISNFDKGACVVTDFSQAYFFGGLIFIAGGLVLAKIIF